MGVVLHAKVGDELEQGQPLFTIHAKDSAMADGARQRLLGAYTWSEEPVEAPPLIHQIVS